MIGEAQISHDRYRLHQNGSHAVIVRIDPPGSGITIRGTLANGEHVEVKISGSSPQAVFLPISGEEITVQRWPDLKAYSIQQVQRSIDLVPIR